MKKQKWIFTFFIILSIGISLPGCSKKREVSNLETKYMSACFVVNMDSPEEVVGFSDNVFVGYVEEMTDTYYSHGFPYTRYSVNVINNIKGELPLDTTVCVNKAGGISEDSSCYILYENDFLPDVGRCYIFTVNKTLEGDSYTASGMNTTVLIDDIDMQGQVDFTTNNSNSLNSKQLDAKSKETSILNNSSIYQRYVDAYKNQVLYDPEKE